MKMQLLYKKSTVLTDHRNFQVFKFLWELRRERKIFPNSTLKYVDKKGIHVQAPEDIFTPAFEPEHYTAPGIAPVVEKPPCYVLTEKFLPIEQLKQIQVLTNSLAFETLSTICAPIEAQPSEMQQLEDAILHSHLLDAKQKYLAPITENLEFEYKWGPQPKRLRGIPMHYRIHNLTKQMLLLLARNEKLDDSRRIFEQLAPTVELTHGDSLFQLKLPLSVLLTSRKSLSPIMNAAQVTEASKDELPSIYPFLPFVHRGVRQLTNYPDIGNTCGMRAPNAVPHTVFVHDNSVFFKDEPEMYQGLALLNAFSTAAAWAKQNNNVDINNDLKKPVTLNTVYTNGRHYQMGIFQLNTLNLTGQTKNLFYTQPWSRLFWNCDFLEATPMLDKFDPQAYNVLKGLYARTG